jgi:small-conductance mechanosensitive channel/CRP-like cAMP-binding protein
MTPTLTVGAVLLAIAGVSMLALRSMPNRVRLTLDLLAFAAISAFLLSRGVLPVFAAPSGLLDREALLMRVVAGAWWVLGARLVVGALKFTLKRDRRSREAKLFSDLAAAALYLAAAAMVLNSVLAFPLAGLVATSGIVAIVLGLALQNTLADVFAGIAVGIEVPFHVGDRILINDKIEGQVLEANWRSVRVQTDADDVAIIPNSLVAKAEIVNRSFPSQRRAASVEVPCRSQVAPEQVIGLLRQAALLCPLILQESTPSVVLSRVGRKWNAYTIAFTVEETKRLSPAKDMLLRLSRRQLHYAGLLQRDPDERSPRDTMMFRRRLLDGLVLLEPLSERELDQIAHALSLTQLQPGEVLFEQGRKDATLYIVASGILKCTRNPGLELLGQIGPGEYVGELGLLTGVAHPATATACTSCRIYRLTQEAIAPLLAANDDLVTAFDRSVRRGLDLLERATVVRATPQIEPKGEFIASVLKLFGMERS